MSDLLDLAEAQLNLPTPHSNRMACWLARAAMEEAIDQLLAAKDLQLGQGASARSKLTCLEVCYEHTAIIPRNAQYAWSRLSEACHQHAYELSPTYTETKHLLRLVQSLAELICLTPRADSSPGDA